MRLIIAPIILFRLKRKYIKDLTSTIKDGWIDDRDLEAIEYLKQHAWKGLTTPFVISYNFIFLKEQVKTLFVDITKIYNDDNNYEINLKFSIQKILEALYLLFDDAHKDLKILGIYKILERLPVNLFLRITKLNRSIKFITQNKIIRILQKYRITTKVFRLILTPFLGIPIIISQLIFSLLYSTLFEGYLRFIYGLILIKVGYYTIYLYSDRNSSLHKRLQFSHKEIIKKGNIIEKNFTEFNNRFIFTKQLEGALKSLERSLIEAHIMPSKKTTKDVDRFDRVLKRLSNTLKNTVDSELNYNKQSNFDFKPLLGIINNIGKVYFPNSNQPIYNLRVKEFLELGYFVTTVSLKNIYLIPTSKQLLDRIPVKFVFDISDFVVDKNLKEYIPKIKYGSRVLKSIQSYYWATRLVVKRSNPVVFAASFVTPILFQQLQDSIKEYIFNISGLLLIDSYESTLLKDKTNKINDISL
ncbi:hypothetical protein EW093_09150 [Thiospirochaeta perfilievii]|uniref:Uncharacterized protein n=1 Tax=Thiospirochaeta perfilievii TaxID=252967 RepID=A0A5C1Q9Q3_9SPIO|nr:hypothetical protein [Thiospirochaeta perfilievii]QEN04863.1 hypothetical protein EW093_09150 [Thiospirochaeta perfilievii]